MTCTATRSWRAAGSVNDAAHTLPHRARTDVPVSVGKHRAKTAPFITQG